MRIINAKAFTKQIQDLWQRLKDANLRGNDLLTHGQAGMFYEIAKRVDEDVAIALDRMEADFAKAFARIESKHPPMTYEGMHEVGKQYKRGQFVSYEGHTWHCNKQTKSLPAEGAAWTLAVRAGRDAR